MVNLGLIGFGKFGQFAARHLRNHVHLFVWDLRDQRKKAASLGLTWGTLEEAASCQAVLLCVPISEMPITLAEVVPYLRRGALLMDVCSVKMAPIEWMMAATPLEVEVLGTHPLFGPDSARSGIARMTVVLCPGRTERVDAVQRLLEKMGLHVVVTSPEDHDRQMAHAQALTHFVARGLAEVGMTDLGLATPTFKELLHVVETLSNDSLKLFNDMHTFNPFAAPARAELLEALRKLDGLIEQE